MTLRWRPILMGAAAAAILVACEPIANMPVALRDEIDQAAQMLKAEMDTPPPAVFEFVSIHCRADGHLLIEFKATSGANPGWVATATSTGDARRPYDLVYSPEDLDGDIARFFAEASRVECPPGPRDRDTPTGQLSS